MLNDLLAWKTEETQLISSLRTSMETKNSELAQAMKKKTSNLPSEFDLPSIWRVFAALANIFATVESNWTTNLNNLRNNDSLKAIFKSNFQTEILRLESDILSVKKLGSNSISTRERRLEEENQKLITELRSETAARNALSRGLFLLTNQLEKLEGFSTTAAKSLKNQITVLTDRFDQLRHGESDNDNSSVETESNPTNLTKIWSTLEKMSTNLD